jgi:hypothetical protein
MVFQEKHTRNDDIRACDIGMAGRQGRLITGKLICGVQGQLQPRDLLAQYCARLIHRATEMAIHRHNDDAGR